MRTARPLGCDPVNFYHCMSRTLGELPYWDDRDKEQLRLILGKLLEFSGLRLVTFCLMGNHFHLLVGVPEERESLESMSDQQLLARLEILYPDTLVQQVTMQLETCRRDGLEEMATRVRQKYLARMHNLSAFMQELKQRFSAHYNRRHDRRGTIWRDRFKSVMVEGSEDALRTMAAYIDLNPIRARLVDDPKDYRWSGYGEAIAGNSKARNGLEELVRGETGEDASTRTWKQVQGIYRCWLYADGAQRRDEFDRVIKPGFTPETVARVEAKQGALAYPVLAKLRIRHFTEGVAIGSRAFVEDTFRRYRTNFSPKRLDGSRKIRAVRWASLVNLRELRS